ncbi:uncharacterized protein [Lolium perenne]|uniref:uncharacterized protein n=1 Tax=Lolium perenne TaxID=4522 RepID=UPI0021F64D84|nr:uncharacterized protein LOC127339042 [Lolium perenne]
MLQTTSTPRPILPDSAQRDQAAAMEGEVGKRALECILMPAMFAAKNVRAQRDRLLQLRRRLQPHADAAAVQELAADLFKVCSTGLKHGAGYLTSCLRIAYDSDADISFCNPAFAFIPDEQLYAALFAHRLPARPPGTQTEAFARIELAYHAVNLASGHHVPRCIEFLVGERPPSGTGKPDGCMVGYPDDTVAAATSHIFKTRLADMLPADADDATKERIPRTRPRLFNRGLDLDPADAPAAAPTWKPPRLASTNDPEQALSYLHRACSLANLAVKHIDLAVAVISTFLDPKEVAETAEMADEDAYISEEGPYPSD